MHPALEEAAGPVSNQLRQCRRLRNQGSQATPAFGNPSRRERSCGVSAGVSASSAACGDHSRRSLGLVLCSTA
eukprot:3126397-Pyramimonas_sp.AAC.1